MPAATFLLLLANIAQVIATISQTSAFQAQTEVNKSNGVRIQVTGNCQLPPASPPPATGPFSRQACLDAINGYRKQKGLSTLALCSQARQTQADQQVQYDGDAHSGHAFLKNCHPKMHATGQCECGRFGSAAKCIAAYWKEGPPKAGGFNHYSIMMDPRNTCVACGFSQKNYDLAQKQQTWTYAQNFFHDGNPPGPAPPPPPSPPAGGLAMQAWGSGKCLDLPGGDTTNGNKLWLWDCNGHDSQAWLFDADSWRMVYKANPSKCIDIPGGDATDGQSLQIWDCNGHLNQQWGYDGDQKTIYSAWNGHVKCIDVNWGDGTGYNTLLQLWDCNGHTNQWWYIQSAANYIGPNQTSLYSLLV
jgi:hypothetical protein